jgi:ubiquinone/menaquinone biosynthesis C-methylase UbiE
MSCQLLSTSLSEAELEARRFYDKWIGGPGLLSMLGRLIFRMSGTAYSGTFIRAARLTPDQSVLEIGCGMGTILTATQRRLCSTASYLGVDLSLQMITQGRLGVLDGRDRTPVSLLVGSGLSLPVGDSLFDVVLLSHVVKYLTDTQLNQTFREARRVLKRGGTIVFWEFHPVLNSSVTRLILRCCKAQKLRDLSEFKEVIEAAGFSDLTSFRVVTPWLPWSNVALTGRVARVQP